jgi:hypothetical protein
MIELLVKAARRFTVVIERDEEGYYIATVPGLPGCHTQAKNLDTLMKARPRSNCAVSGNESSDVGPLELVGIQQISV